jgi:hypothetical protein
VPSHVARPQHRLLSSTAARSAGDHAHEDHYDPPGGWLFGVKPGQQYENEGWENVWFYGFFGSLLFGVVGYCYKPDTRYVEICRNTLLCISGVQIARTDKRAAYKHGHSRKHEDGWKRRAYWKTPTRRDREKEEREKSIC